MPSAHPRDAVRVCLASPLFAPAYSGAALRFERYLPGLIERGLDLRVLAGTPDRSRRSLAADDGRAGAHGERAAAEGADAGGGPERVGGAPVQRVRLPAAPGARRMLTFGHRLAGFCARAEPRPDVVQLLALSPAMVPTVLRLRALGIPVVFAATIMPALPEAGPRRWLLRQSLVFPQQLVDRVVVSTEVLRSRLRSLGLRTPIRVIPNGVDTRRFRPAASPDERARLRLELGIPRDAPVLLYVGGVSPRKRVDLLLEAWTHLAPRHPELRLLVVGPRRDLEDARHRDFARRLKRLLRASGAADRVCMVGRVENPEAYMRAVDVFVFTSSREGMPNVVAEAMASGLPVVTTPFIGRPPAFGRPGRHYVLAEAEPDALAGRVGHLLACPELRRALGRQARAWTERRLAVERSLDGYAALYRAVAA